MIKILLADDHKLFREGIVSLLKIEKDFMVIGEAEDGADLITKFNETKPDIIVTDISMPGINGVDAIKSLLRKNEEVKALFLSQYSGDDYIHGIFEAGGQGLISKNVLQAELVNAIKTVADGKNYFCGKTEKELEAIIKRFTVTKGSVNTSTNKLLTKKEKEILLLINKCLSSRQIAEKLNVSVRTIDTHRMNIIKKFQLKSLPGIISFAKDFAERKK
jgi:DNA-binding NarL/FixJ family response regulator